MRRSPAASLLVVVALAGAVAACKPTRMAPPVDSTGAFDTGGMRSGPVVQPPQQTLPADSGATPELRRLEREAAALAKTAGCEQSGDCRTAPVGQRACGGPRYYLAYCARTTDSTALFRKLDELARAEAEYNQREGMMSTCEFRVPPAVQASGGSCRAVP